MVHCVVLWGIFIPLLHLSCVVLFRVLNIFPLPTRKGNRGSDIIAVEVVSCVCMAYCGVVGLCGFFNLFGVMDNIDVYSGIGRFYARSEYIEYKLVYPMLCYQLWNLVVSVYHVEYRDLAGIGHHVVTSGLAYCGLHPYAQFYALFYFGVAELTTVPLTVVTVFRHIPQLHEQYTKIYSFMKACFAISYFVIRLLWWPCVSYDLFFGCVDLIANNTAHSVQVVSYFLFSNLFLTGLQFYWGYLMIRNATKDSKSTKKKQ